MLFNYIYTHMHMYIIRITVLAFFFSTQWEVTLDGVML